MIVKSNLSFIYFWILRYFFITILSEYFCSDFHSNGIRKHAVKQTRVREINPRSWIHTNSPVQDRDVEVSDWPDLKTRPWPGRRTTPADPSGSNLTNTRLVDFGHIVCTPAFEQRRCHNSLHGFRFTL